MKRIIVCIVSALSIILVPFNSYASETDTVIDLNELYGLTIEEMYAELDETGAFLSPVLNTLDTGDYRIEENISLSTGGIATTYVNNNGTFSQTIPFGYSLAVYNVAKNITCTLYNNGSPLFTKGGTLYLNLSSYASTIVMHVTYTDGSGYQEQFTGNWSSGSSYIEVVVNNSDANISKIQFMYSGAIQQSNGDYALRGGIFKYGYILDDTAGGDSSQVSSDILSALNNFFNPYWTNFYNRVLSALDGSEIVTELLNVSSKLGYIADQLQLNVSAFWNLVRSNITNYLTTINTSIQDYITVFKDRMSLLYSQLTVSSSAFWNNFDTKLSDVLDRYWASDSPTSDDVKTEIGNISSSENDIFNGGMSYVEDFDFEENSIDNLGESTIKGFTFVTGIMERLYANSGDYGTVVNITFTMLLASIGLGLKRFWSK